MYVTIKISELIHQCKNIMDKCDKGHITTICGLHDELDAHTRLNICVNCEIGKEVSKDIKDCQRVGV